MNWWWTLSKITKNDLRIKSIIVSLLTHFLVFTKNSHLWYHSFHWQLQSICIVCVRVPSGSLRAKNLSSLSSFGSTSYNRARKKIQKTPPPYTRTPCWVSRAAPPRLRKWSSTRATASPKHSRTTSHSSRQLHNTAHSNYLSVEYK